MHAWTIVSRAAALAQGSGTGTRALPEGEVFPQTGMAMAFLVGTQGPQGALGPHPPHTAALRRTTGAGAGAGKAASGNGISLTGGRAAARALGTATLVRCVFWLAESSLSGLYLRRLLLWQECAGGTDWMDEQMLIPASDGPKPKSLALPHPHS